MNKQDSIANKPLAPEAENLAMVSFAVAIVTLLVTVVAILRE